MFICFDPPAVPVRYLYNLCSHTISLMIPDPVWGGLRFSLWRRNLPPFFIPPLLFTLWLTHCSGFTMLPDLFLVLIQSFEYPVILASPSISFLTSLWTLWYLLISTPKNPFFTDCISLAAWPTQKMVQENGTASLLTNRKFDGIVAATELHLGHTDHQATEKHQIV